jgi:chitinase
MNVQCKNKGHDEIPGTVIDEDEDENEIESGSPQKPVTTRRTTTTKRPTVAPTKPRPTKPPVLSDPAVLTGNNEYMVVCYFTNWAWYRPGVGKYKPSNIDTNLCTHIVYGFAVLNGETLTIKTHDSWADIDNNFYTQVSSLQEKGIKVSIAIGGWNDSLGNKYSRLVLDPKARARFIANIIEFMKKYNFQGLDLDWEYPVCWQVDCTKGKAEEKEAFANWVKELAEAFKPHGFLLSAAVSPSKKVIDAGYDIPKISKYMDWIAVMCYVSLHL